MANGILSAARYQKWLTPKQALARVSDPTSDVARRGWIARRLADGLIRAAARTVVQPIYPDRHFLVLARSDWRIWAHERDTDFWEGGDYAGLATSSTGYEAYFSAPFRAYGVRLDPALFDKLDRERHQKNAEGWDRLFEAIRPSVDLATAKLADQNARAAAEAVWHYQEAAAQSRRVAETPVPATAVEPTDAEAPVPKVSPKVLLDWARDYAATHPDAAFADFRDAARSSFPNLRIGERPVKGAIAKLGLTKKRGNPTIQRK